MLLELAMMGLGLPIPVAKFGMGGVGGADTIEIFAGAGRLSISTNARLAIPTVFGGSGSLSALGNLRLISSVPLSGAGSLTATFA